MNKRIFAFCSTTSKGKIENEKRLSLYRRGETIAMLVGAGEGLERHVLGARLDGFKKIWIYERHLETYNELVKEKNRLYPDDSDIMIIKGDLLEHDFINNPIDCVDFDSCDSIDQLIRNNRLDTQLLFDLGIKVICLTFSARTHYKSELRQLARMHEVSDAGLQRELVTKILKKKYPTYAFKQWGYRGKDSTYGDSHGGCSMYSIVGVNFK